MMDHADPLDGWPMNELMQFAKPAKNDLYGALYRYLTELFTRFCQRLKSVNIHLQVNQVDAIALKDTLELPKGPEHLFDRIEVSAPV